MSSALPKAYLVRHGETAWTISGQHTGLTDIPLTEQGERDAERLKARLAGLAFEGVLSSPLKRARRTAELAGFPNPVEMADLVEWDYGAYEGRRTADIRIDRPDWRLLEDGCPGGETLAAVSGRADRVVERIRDVARDVLVFAHRDILRVLAARWLGLESGEARIFALAPASLSVLGYDHDLDEPVIKSWNEEMRET